MDDSIINYKFIHDKIMLLIEKKQDMFKNMKTKENLDLKIQKLNSISNITFKVTILEEDSFKNNLIFKIYRNNEVNREYEEKIIKILSSYKMCPEIYDSDKSTYRIEEYLDNYEELSYSDTMEEEILEKLIQILLKFNVVLGESLIQYKSLESIIEKETFYPLLMNFHNKSMHVIEYCLEKCKNNSQFSFLKDKLLNIKQFTDNYPNILKNLFPKSLFLTLSHNDVHALNILRQISSSDLILMDYEYSCYNIIGFDISNYFVESFFNFSVNEFPYFKMNRTDFENLFDNPIYYNIFIFYLKSFLQRNNINSSLLNSNDLMEKDYFYRTLCLGSIFWVIVAVSNINLDDIVNKSGFDYIEYSLERLKIYQIGISRINY